MDSLEVALIHSLLSVINISSTVHSQDVECYLLFCQGQGLKVGFTFHLLKSQIYIFKCT